MQKEWIVHKCDETAAQAISNSLGVHPIVAKVLLNRGITTAEAAKAYFTPNLSDIPDPFSLPGMETAVERIVRAIFDEEPIAIFGDYDVDGITGAALLAYFLRELGANPTVMLPNRVEGYGLAEHHIMKLSESGVKLLITVDNGIRAIDEIKLAAGLGIDAVITDHHELDESLPDARAVLNPHRLCADHPLRELSGCGVAFMLALAIRKHLRDTNRLPSPEPNLKKHLDLVAMGTIADVMPLTGMNRMLVSHGLAEISRSSKAGIRALLEVSCTAPEGINPVSVAFRLAPRINAAGRMGNPYSALELLLSDDAIRTRDIARILDKTNRERQFLEQKILSDTERIVRNEGYLDNRFGLVLHSDGWHVGVLGIVAARIVERTTLPTIIVTSDTSPARGSARSVEGINLLDAIAQCDDLLIGFGGHAMAAGITIDPKNLDEFEKRFDDACRRLAGDAAKPRLEIDAAAGPGEITNKLVDDLLACHPFGIGNPEPVLSMEDITIFDSRIVGDDHIKLRVGNSSTHFDAIGFRMGKLLPKAGCRASIAFSPQYNTWNGVTSIQLNIKDIRECSR